MSKPTRERALELFDVDVERGRVFWKKTLPSPRRRVAGTEAGSAGGEKSKRYWAIGVDGRYVKRGHIIYLVAHGKWPSPLLDHINGNSLDDRLANLRAANTEQNAQNVRKRAPSGLPMGVNRMTSGRFKARIRHKRKLIYLGVFETATEAAATYQAKRRELFGAFA